MAEDREIAGIRCMQVLEKLDAYVASELTVSERTQIEDHLKGCQWCAKFGGRYAALVDRLRMRLLLEETDPATATSLAERLLRKRHEDPSGEM